MLKRSLMALSVVVGLSGLTTTATTPAVADPAAGLATARHFADGTLAAGEAELSAMIAADPGNHDARLGLGMIRFVAAVEHLSQGLYRYGLEAPRGTIAPIVRLPVPVNPHPEPVTYDAFRGLLQAFVDDLADSDAMLATVAGDRAKVPIDLRKVACDIDGDGRAGDEEHLLAVLGVVSGMSRPRRGDGDDDWLPPDATVAFDAADAIWLRGYSHALMAIGEFLLAHDWRQGFDASFHAFFPHAKLPVAAALARRTVQDRRGTGAEIADWVSFIHLLRWPVVEPERMGTVRDHLKEVVALSRRNWDAIEAESDDDREWLPNPRQRSAVVTFSVSAGQIAAWRVVLDEFDAILDGRKLVPHWRFEQAVNLRRVFTEPTTFDLVLWITGPAALAYLEDGPVSTGARWRGLAGSFGPAFGSYLVWFN